MTVFFIKPTNSEPLQTVFFSNAYGSKAKDAHFAGYLPQATGQMLW